MGNIITTVTIVIGAVIIGLVCHFAPWMVYVIN